MLARVIKIKPSSGEELKEFEETIHQKGETVQA